MANEQVKYYPDISGSVELGTVIADYVVVRHPKHFYELNRPIYDVTFKETAWTGDAKEPHYQAIWCGFVTLEDGRIIEMEALFAVREDGIYVTAEEVKTTTWEQPATWLGWKWELGHLWRRYREAYKGVK